MIPKNKKPYDLELRTFEFASGIIKLCQRISKDLISNRLISQLIDSSGSVGANYREANEALSKKDFLHRVKIARKECKEVTYWLQLLVETDPTFRNDMEDFIKESRELRNIFTAIIERSQ